MSRRGSYRAPPIVYATSKLFQKGKTQVPGDVRNLLNLKDGDWLVWFRDNGEIFIKKLEGERLLSL